MKNHVYKLHLLNAVFYLKKKTATANKTAIMKVLIVYSKLLWLASNYDIQSATHSL